MIKRLLALDGVNVVFRFRDDGRLVEGYGLMAQEDMVTLAKYAYDFRRMVHSNTDQFSLFTDMQGWAPPDGWVMRGPQATVCGVSSVVCIVENSGAPLNDILLEMSEVARW